MSSYSITQNTFFLTTASVLQKIISFVYFSIIARIIGVGNTGQYFFAIAFTTIFAVLADFGLGPVLTREASKYPEQSEKYINTLLITKIVFGLITYGLVILAINILHYSPELKLLITISGLTMFFDNLQSVFYSVLRARQNLIYESVGMVGSQLITLIIGTIVLVLHAPLVWLIVAYTIPSALNVLYAALISIRAYGLKIRLNWDKQIFKNFIIIALPFALAGIIARLYAYTDSVMMSKLLGAEHLGWWSVPYKITFAFQFIPIALSTSVYPVMSSLSVHNRDDMSALLEKSWRYLLMIVFPLIIGLGIIARPFILAVYGKAYAPSVPVLQILLISLSFGFLSFITGALLNASNKQTTQTALLAVALVVNVCLNIALLPKFGLIGAAVAALLGNMTLCIGGYIFASYTVHINHKNIVNFIGRALWPAAAMGVVVYLLSAYIHFTLVIPIGMLVYGALSFISGALPREQVATIYNTLMQMIRRKQAAPLE